LQNRICVIDGQGGGIGATVIKYLKKAYGEGVELIALGTNAIATAQMLKAGANKGATGENAILRTVAEVHCIVGPIAITWANAMLGEVTLMMAEAVTSSLAAKILLPLHQERVEIVGIVKEPLPHLVEKAVEEKIREVLNHV
jgi:NAD(P)-dependent dehydrogenase (short-subunit alcohol dehydrogenase family)